MSDPQAGVAPPIFVLFVEDDDLYREALGLQLEDHGFTVQGFADGKALLTALGQAVEADVLLLDWHLPDLSGTALLSAIRRRDISLPVVFLTGRSEVDLEGQAFDHGAIDFIDKSRGIDILARRLRRAVQWSAWNQEPRGDRLVRGGLTLHRRVSRAWWNGVDLHLTVGEYNVVALLARNAGDFVPYDALYEAQRTPGFIPRQGGRASHTNVRAAIKRTRNKFRAIDPTFDEIESYMSFGYRWRQRT